MTSTRPGMKKALAAVEGSVPSATSTAAASANSAAFSAAVAASSPCSASSPSMPPSCSEARVRGAASPPPEVVTVWTEVPSAWTTVVVVVNLLITRSVERFGLLLMADAGELMVERSKSFIWRCVAMAFGGTAPGAWKHTA